jgi:hypothetical protein
MELSALGLAELKIYDIVPQEYCAPMGKYRDMPALRR